MAIEGASLPTTPGQIPIATLFSFRRRIMIVDARESLYRPCISKLSFGPSKRRDPFFSFTGTITPTAFGHLDLFDFGVD